MTFTNTKNVGTGCYPFHEVRPWDCPSVKKRATETPRQYIYETTLRTFILSWTRREDTKSLSLIHTRGIHCCYVALTDVEISQVSLRQEQSAKVNAFYDLNPTNPTHPHRGLLPFCPARVHSCRYSYYRNSATKIVIFAIHAKEQYFILN